MLNPQQAELKCCSGIEPANHSPHLSKLVKFAKSAGMKTNEQQKYGPYPSYWLCWGMFNQHSFVCLGLILHSN